MSKRNYKTLKTFQNLKKMKSAKKASLKSEFTLSKRSSRRSTAQCENFKLGFTEVPRTESVEYGVDTYFLDILPQSQLQSIIITR